MRHIHIKTFISEIFLLNSLEAQTLYHDFAKRMPIIDYHHHLAVDMLKVLIPNDIEFIGNMIKDICYHNAVNYFNFN